MLLAPAAVMGFLLPKVIVANNSHFIHICNGKIKIVRKASRSTQIKKHIYCDTGMSSKNISSGVSCRKPIPGP
jgi:hypothetical protein